ncbi:MAG: hypothetical protein ABWY54_03745, partial [Glaciihabitans sp.]
ADVRAAVTHAALGANSPAEWTAVVDAIEDDPAVLDIGLNEAARTFDQWVEDLFESEPDGVADLGAFNDLEHVASRLGLSTDSTSWQLMYDVITARPDMNRTSAESIGSSIVQEADDIELHSLFARLRRD